MGKNILKNFVCIIFFSFLFISFSNAQLKIQAPKCNIKSGIYKETKAVTFLCKDKNCRIYYTLDGSEPSENSLLFNDPFILDKSALIKAAAFKGGKRSGILTVDFALLKNIESVNFISAPSKKYPAKDMQSILDGKPASDNLKDGSWFGFEGEDFEIVISFEKKCTVSSAEITCMQDINSGIFLPEQIEVYVSPDNKTFFKSGLIEKKDLTGNENKAVAEFICSSRTAVAKSVKIICRNLKLCPAGHKDEGKKAWLFISKISVK